MSRNYQVIIDMERALAFYSKLFQSNPLYRGEDFSLFRIHGKPFGLIEQKFFKQSSIIHDDDLLRIKVGDIQSEFERIRFIGVETDEEIHESVHLSFFQFADSEGNAVRIFSI